jgi:hypothetical protein
MGTAIGIQDSTDLAFFGKVNASVSHELKNILAIISETTGFLNDLTEMAKEGTDIDLETLKTSFRDIIEEIERGFLTVKHMNRFSHSVDDVFKSINLVETIDLMIALSGFLSFAGRVRFDPPEKAGPDVLTCPFRLQNLIYQTLVFAFESAGPDGEISVSVNPEMNDRVRITFSGFGVLDSRTFPTGNAARIAETIGAQIGAGNDSQAIDIVLPLRLDEGG